MANTASMRGWKAVGLLGGLVGLAALAAFGTAGWAMHGERLYLAMADGAWISCF